MNRKEFLKKTALATSIISGFPVTGVFAKKLLTFNTATQTDFNDLTNLSDELNTGFLNLIEWLKTNKWVAYLKAELNLDLNLSGEALLKELTKDIDDNETQKLQDLKKQSNTGFDDFVGNWLIRPGYPALSLLYHILASPRVKLDELQRENYPTYKELDTLENYIYALKKWEDYKIDYGITYDNEFVLAVFAYEYRPAYKTPHHSHADLVYSRTGVARIGDEPVNYDAMNRSYTNQPKASDDPTGQRISVTPARYGLFLAKVIQKKDNDNTIVVMKTGNPKPGDIFNESTDNSKYFLHPIRKVFNDDKLFDNSRIEFLESHESVKLSKLKLQKGNDQPAYHKDLIKYSRDLIETKSEGSSFLVISKHDELLREVKEYSFNVRPKSSENKSQRWYNTFTEIDPNGDPIETLYNSDIRIKNTYKNARNTPMYVHIGHDVNKNFDVLKKNANSDYEVKIAGGDYNAIVYEDSICDGCVSVKPNLYSSQFPILNSTKIYSAFSIVTAPDFFPQVDVFDLINYDVASGISNESSFYEGGIASLATARVRPNTNLKTGVGGEFAFPLSNNKDKAYNTLTAVLSSKPDGKSEILAVEKYKETWKRDYSASGFLPDVCSSVFAPGWDITFSNDDSLENIANIYLSTQGLGSPFVEDMKLCAAMNGMWPAAAPDTARTFQGTGDYNNRASIPLMDNESGFHKNSPAGKNTLGWDGEQGPFIEKRSGDWGVNFTDLYRVDYVENALKKYFNMSILRGLTSQEIITRMECLKKSIKIIEGDSAWVAKTNLWLVSAEKLDNENTAEVNFKGYGIPNNLRSNDKTWATKVSFTVPEKESCYLFVFVRPKSHVAAWIPLNRSEPAEPAKRKFKKIKNNYVVQVSINNITLL